jgi:hypothetical protein
MAGPRHRRLIAVANALHIEPAAIVAATVTRLRAGKRHKQHFAAWNVYALDCAASRRRAVPHALTRMRERQIDFLDMQRCLRGGKITKGPYVPANRRCRGARTSGGPVSISTTREGALASISSSNFRKPKQGRRSPHDPLPTANGSDRMIRLRLAHWPELAKGMSCPIRSQQLATKQPAKGR